MPCIRCQRSLCRRAANIMQNNYKRKGRIMKRQLLKSSSGTVCCDNFFSDVRGCSGSKETLVCGQGQERCVQGDRGQGKNTATIAGPFKTKVEAEKRKAKDCPTGVGQTTDRLRPSQEQPEQMRRQHQQREEPQRQQLKKQQTPQQQQQKLAPQQQQQTEKMKGKAQGKTEGSKPSEEKVKEKTTEPIPSEKKN